jgi:hypothetical protein
MCWVKIHSTSFDTIASVETMLRQSEGPSEPLTVRANTDIFLWPGVHLRGVRERGREREREREREMAERVTGLFL